MLTAALASGWVSAAANEPAPLVAQAWAVLETDWREAKDWEQIHAAEVMIFLGHQRAVREEMLANRTVREAGKSRIGVWRVLAQTASGPDERRKWVEKIGAVFMDEDAPDRAQAIETLAKLKEPGTPVIQAEALHWVRSDDPIRHFVAVWFLAEAHDEAAVEAVEDMLAEEDENSRRLGAYALSRLGTMRLDLLNRLAYLADNEADDSIAAPYVLAAALNLKADPTRRQAWVERLQRVMGKATAGAQLEAARALRSELTAEAAAGMKAGLAADAVDARLGAAWMILHANERNR